VSIDNIARTARGLEVEACSFGAMESASRCGGRSGPTPLVPGRSFFLLAGLARAPGLVNRLPAAPTVGLPGRFALTGRDENEGDIVPLNFTSHGLIEHMADGSQVPAWVSYLQALTVPVFAAVGAWIAARQMLIADEKLQNEAFDRRYERRLAFYNETVSVLPKIYRRELSPDEIRGYKLRCQEARFMFDPPMQEFIGEFVQQLDGWALGTQMMSDRLLPGVSEKGTKKESQHWGWFRRLPEGDVLDGKFRPYLTQARPKRPWLLRWP
jgi:hypothetical protein